MPERNSDQFLPREVAPPPRFAHVLERVVLASKPREVRALTGFTHIESPGFGGDWSLEGIEVAALSRRPPTWLPAVEVRGEGIFLQFREEAIAAWQERFYQVAGDRYQTARRRWQAHHGGSPTGEDDGGFARYLLIHSLSHALMREFALGSGYTVASIRERIYAAAPDAPSGAMAGLLLYTSASDSEGTLGGLVKLGEPTVLERHLREALSSVHLCASDPHPRGASASGGRFRSQLGGLPRVPLCARNLLRTRQPTSGPNCPRGDIIGDRHRVFSIRA